jgi:trehalose 6-phosphate phosphatase
VTGFPPLPRGGAAALPPVERAALLLDLDGTLLDIAPTPDSVVVAAGLRETLLRVRALLGDALAVITGRPIAEVDRLLPGVAYAVAGEHGGAIRHNPGAAAERPELPAPPAAWLLAAERLAAAHPGVLLERKPRGFTLHYRAAPQYRDALLYALRNLLAPQATRFALLPARKAWEIRPLGVDKGTAVLKLMARPPFAGRLPVFLGDDVTDEDAIAAAFRYGGAGLRVPEAFGDAAGVRDWLHRLAQENLGETR